MYTWENSGTLNSDWHFQGMFWLFCLFPWKEQEKMILLGLDKLNWKSLGYPGKNVDWTFVNVVPGVRQGFQS